MTKQEIAEIRRAVADYMASEGCSCCQNTEKHQEAKAKLAKLLHVPKYEDGSGYNFYRFRKEQSDAQAGNQ